VKDIPSLPEGWYWWRCMLGCMREGLPVKWLGPIRIPRGEGQLYGCTDCVPRLLAMVEEDLGAADEAALVAR
jgi:hypothetical protein